MRLRLVFWRHGQTVQNLSLRIQGAQDFPLDDVGHAQASETAGELAKMKPARIYSSDLWRARQTAEYLSEVTGVPILMEPGLRERAYGSWEGLTSAEIRERDPEQWMVWREGREPEGVGVERREDCGMRVADAVSRAVADVEAELSQSVGKDDVVTVVFVAHGGSISNGVMTLLGQNPSEWVGLQGMDNCHWAILEPRHKANPPWRLYSYNRRTVDVATIDRPGF
ncbi:histidine phosphatase family protein [Trueperella pecoris]|uniref:Histidine phosphatase family protein n=1 Tax=Trueperella pecoris TaxID=2733571 RepID=A0A7M1QU42_9ACTO|nr:histidine phosphatase family protein [Trueperella pecoris]QOQ38621.1 histidine phosphatase family protein [Trueperella pecoris]QOR44885.1 histidine phosphatase family protein [Trueperella pecoris]QTG74795.1 histidine phosphatase family protein [Trueperella pecoris]